jgi:cardiolipin synthase
VLSQIPNLLTLLRIAACPVLVLLLNERSYDGALAVFLFAGITDGLDGFIAKRFNFVSRLGTLLDPIADKMLIVSAYIMLALLADIPFWLLVVVAFRDLLIVGGYLVLVSIQGDVQMRPSRMSKVNTFLQITLVLAILVDRAGWFAVSMLVSVLIPGVLLTTVLSGAHYVWVWGIRRQPGNAVD